MLEVLVVELLELVEVVVLLVLVVVLDWVVELLLDVDAVAVEKRVELPGGGGVELEDDADGFLSAPPLPQSLA